MWGGRSTSSPRSPRERDLVRHLSTDLRLPALQRLPWEPGPRRFSSRWPTVRTGALQDALDLRYLRVLARWRVHQGAKQMPIASQLAPQIEQFIHDNPQGVLTSFRRNGMPQLSIVTVYPRDGGVGISITETRMKFKNLLRDPRCSVLISHADWWSGFLVFDGTAQILGFVFAGASTVIALAMLLLVVWQAPRHRHNRLMAVYLATLVLWGANNLAARACALIGCSPDVFTYGTLAFNGINAFVLFW